MFLSPMNPKCPATSPTNKTNVTPKEIPKNFCFPRYTPKAMTNEYSKTVWATDSGLNSKFSIQFIFTPMN